MKILVPMKRVPDPTQKAKIKDGHIDLTGASWIVNTFDEYAVETALRLLENGETNTRTGGEIVVRVLEHLWLGVVIGGVLDDDLTVDLGCDQHNGLVAERLRDGDHLAEAHFAAIAELAPELVILGSGPRIRFVRPALLKPLIERRIGVETMDTAAACRTYNVLLAEGRSVVAALVFEAPVARGSTTGGQSA